MAGLGEEGVGELDEVGGQGGEGGEEGGEGEVDGGSWGHDMIWGSWLGDGRGGGVSKVAWKGCRCGSETDGEERKAGLGRKSFWLTRHERGRRDGEERAPRPPEREST